MLWSTLQQMRVAATSISRSGSGSCSNSSTGNVAHLGSQKVLLGLFHLQQKQLLLLLLPLQQGQPLLLHRTQQLLRLQQRLLLQHHLLLLRLPPKQQR